MTTGQVAAQASTAVAPVVLDPIQISVEQFKEALPAKVKKSVNASLIQSVTQLLGDPDMFEAYRDNLIGYTSVMADGKFRVDQYVSAVKYVSHKLMGCTNIDAYSKTFPMKIADFSARGVSSKDIASYVTAYNKSKLVNLIFEQTLVPMHVLNQDMYQKALNIQMDLAQNAQSEKVRSDAANSILTHLKTPESTKIKLDVGIEGATVSTIADLRASVEALTMAQREHIQQGFSTAKSVAEQKLVIDADAQDV